MTAHALDITLHLFSLAMVLGITGLGLAALPWSQPQSRDVEGAFLVLLRLGRGWFAGRLMFHQAARTTSSWPRSRSACVSGPPLTSP
jgi:hypothetical protein